MSEDLRALLRATDMFNGLDEPALEVLTSKARRVELRAGETLFRRGDTGEAMFVLLRGGLRIHDERSVFNTLTAPATFGEFALLDSVTRTASATASEPCVLHAIDKDEFLGLLDANAAISRSIIRSLIRQVTDEKDRSEALLQNMLPREIAEEYKRNGSVKVRKHELVSVLFSDFEGFTRVSAEASPDWVIEELDHCFSEFDRITDRYNVQKIKTIGDGYMCVSGLLHANPAHSVDIVLAGLEMQRFMEARHREQESAGVDYWRCRVGVNSGECLSAVIGKSKLTYDIWSDAVNMASRLESSGAPGRVNVGESTYKLVTDFFVCESRGRVEVKHQGKIPMYFVDGIRPELSVRGEGLEPNAEFFRRRDVHFR